VRVATTGLIASTQRDPSARWVPKLPVRHKPPGRIARAAVVLVGSTPAIRTNVHRAADPLRIARHLPAVCATPQGCPALRRRAPWRRMGRILLRNSACGTVPSRTRCPPCNLCRACARRAAPISWARPPRALIAAQSRSRCAQHTCRHRVGYHGEARQRSVTRRPPNCAPSSAGTPVAPRDRRPTHTGPHAVPAPHTLARVRPARPPGSSRGATGATRPCPGPRWRAHVAQSPQAAPQRAGPHGAAPPRPDTPHDALATRSPPA